MTPDELLQRHPRAALRWVRGRLGLSQLALALELGLGENAVGQWEAGRRRITLAHQRRLAGLLVPHLATDEGRAFLATLGAERDRGG